MKHSEMLKDIFLLINNNKGEPLVRLYCLLQNTLYISCKPIIAQLSLE